ncbi:hypothetical protein B0T24DRAFT_540027 [Lasiosphaeria ovina]|uniref:DUF7924 domain-containing protein n=1 Tax=Lasiosphaeria ovina TaxID=92902 RepID=A0AAE0JSX0_9PEZI|nr:hypothetical protein B0T24DRAFT_540027 [Lasiosphaeria ovina]
MQQQQQQRRSARLVLRGKVNSDSDRDNSDYDDDDDDEYRHHDDYDQKDDNVEGFNDPAYRATLRLNYINFRHAQKKLPHTVAAYVGQMASTLSEMPEPSPESVAKVIYELNELNLRDLNESGLKGVLKIHFFRQDRELPFKRHSYIRRMRLPRHLLPSNAGVADVPAFTLSRPRPDLTYGYPDRAFTMNQRSILSRLHDQIPRYAQVTYDIWFPFFAVEFKAVPELAPRGSLWVAANQCATTSAACIRAIDQLDMRLGDAGYNKHIPNLCYSLALDHNLAQLYVSWGEIKKTRPAYYFQLVDSFSLLNPEQLIRLHRWMTAIFDWGYGERLSTIRLAVDYIQQAEEQKAGQQKVASGAAKSRRPSPESSSPEWKRRRLR